MNNKQQQYSCINTSETETYCEGPIIIAGKAIFIDANAKPYNVTAELLRIQMELYGEMLGEHVRYVDGKLVQHNNGKKNSRRRNFIQIAEALSKEEIDKQIRSLILV
jgi:hypothetical protein